MFLHNIESIQSTSQPVTKLSFSISPLTKHQIFCTKLRKYSATSHKTWLFSFSPSTIKDWNNLDLEIRKSKSISIFKSNILKFIRLVHTKPNNVYYCHNPKVLRLLTRLCLVLIHLCEHKFKHIYQDCLNPLYFCANEIEWSTHYLLHCDTYANERMNLLNKNRSTNCSILEFSDAVVTKVLVIGDNTLSNSSNTCILNSTIDCHIY